MTASVKHMQFDGTLGSAKAIAAWVNDPTKINAGPGYLIEQGVPDDHPGGLDLIGADPAGNPVYQTVQPGDYVVNSGAELVVFTAQQFAVAFPEG